MSLLRIKGRRAAELEGRDGLHKTLCLRLEADGRAGHLLDQCRVLLGDLVHPLNGLADLAHARALVGAC